MVLKSNAGRSLRTLTIKNLQKLIVAKLKHMFFLI